MFDGVVTHAGILLKGFRKGRFLSPCILSARIQQSSPMWFLVLDKNKMINFHQSMNVKKVGERLGMSYL